MFKTIYAMLCRETFIMKLIWLSDSKGRVLKIQLQRSVSGETLIFSDTEALKRFIETWSEKNVMLRPKQDLEEDEDNDAV
jgi:hypothetical protein